MQLTNKLYFEIGFYIATKFD